MEFLQFLTPEIFDALIIGVIIVGLVLAAIRLYRDFTRPLPRNPREDLAMMTEDDTKPRQRQDQ